MATPPSALHGQLPGGRSPWYGKDAHTAQMNDYERRNQTTALVQALQVSQTVTPSQGYAIVTSGSSVTLPTTYIAPLHIKNATGSTLTINASTGSTIYSTSAGQSSVSAADGESYTFVRRNNTWYVV